jgi:malonate transporter and related proteins
VTVATIVVPVFALIALGYVAARFRWLSEPAQKGLAEFSAVFAIPALLFRTVSSGATLQTSPLRIWIAFFGALILTWLAAMLMGRFVLRRPSVDWTSIAMTSTYGNTVMLGIPLCLSVYGDAAAAPIAIILSIHTAILWGSATLQHQLLLRSDATDAGSLFFSLIKDLARNPLIVAIVCGVVWRVSGLGLAPVVDRTLGLMAQAGIPTALVALGTSLAGFAIAGQGPTLATVLCLKLLAMPALALGFGLWLALPPVPLGVAVLFAAMPAGANAYLFAARVDRAIHSASGAVALGTALSLATVSLLVAVLPR